MAVTASTWRISGIAAYGGGDLALSQLRLWGGGAFVDMGATITSSAPPLSGNLSDLLTGVGTCVFAASDVRQAGFCIEIELPSAAEVWGLRCAGPDKDRYLRTYILAARSQAPAMAATLGSVAFNGVHVLAAAPTGAPKYLYAADGVWRGNAWAAPGLMSISMTPDGQTLYRQEAGYYPQVSRDAGASWTLYRGLPVGSRVGCAITADGQTLLCAEQGANKYLSWSKDGGATWAIIPEAGAAYWNSCAMTPDGQVLVGAPYNGQLIRSTDAGVTWSAVASAGVEVWQTIAISAGGQYMLAGFNGGAGLKLSKDYGVTWLSVPGWAPISWVGVQGVGISDDGQVIVVAAASQGYYPIYSLDGGASFTVRSASAYGAYFGCAVTPDGQMMLWTGGDGSFVVRPYSWLTSAPPGTALAASVMIGHAAEIAQAEMPQASVAQVAVDAEFGGKGRIFGRVERKAVPANIPLSRRVRLHRSRDGLLARETWSQADGSYEFSGLHPGYEYDVIAFDHERQEFSTIANNQRAEVVA